MATPPRRCGPQVDGYVGNGGLAGWMPLRCVARSACGLAKGAGGGLGGRASQAEGRIVLHLTDIRYRYRPGAAWALDGVSLDVARGEVLGLLGPNGAGKSTLMALVSGLRRPQEGVIRRAAEVEARGGFAWVPQDNAFYPMLSCAENLEFFAGVLECSGGLRRRLNLAIGLVGDPQLLLLDEPTTGVDPQSRNFLLEAVLELRRRGKTILYTSHYMEEVQRVSDRVAIIDHGRLLRLGALGELLAEGAPRLRVRTRRAPTPGERATLAAECGLEADAEGAEGWLGFGLGGGRRPEDVLGRLRALGLEATGIQAGCRNLEELFLNLTRRSLRD
jgi:ABC-2 type transport system ATP-binding protein